MTSILPLSLLILGFVFLIYGANWLVDGATSIGIRAKMSPLIIGLTIVAFGTSLPEMMVNVFSCAKGSSELAIGNIVGSNTMNILFILGMSALFCPINVNRISIRRDIPVGFLATAMLYFMANDTIWGAEHKVNWVDGIVLLLLGFAYLLLTLLKHDGDQSDDQANIQKPLPWGKTLLFILAGITGLYLGGEFVSRNAQALARNWGMSENTIGLTIVAMATSLPELITSIVAAHKGNSDIAIGNVLGSNILNIFLVLGVSSLILPLRFDFTMNMQLFILFAANALMLLFVFTGKGHKISRGEGIMLVLGYAGFVVYSLMAA